VSISEYLNQDQEDILKELINISFGMAASLIGDMLSSYAHLHVPHIDIISIKDLNDIAKQKMKNEDSFYVLKQRFVGELSGEVMFVLDKSSARIFADLLLGSDNDISEDELRQPILELINIITSACIGELCQIINSETIFSVPTIEQQSTIDVDEDEKMYDNVISIETTLDLQEENISGYMFILLTSSELEKLKRRLDVL
jgi:chemotaxis protein CheC